MAIAKGIPTALVVDDVDTTVGEWKMNTGTVNHQQVLAELMHLADQPVDRSRNFPRRAPVFVTGNNLKRLYPPLRRHGRMNSFAWRPEPHELRAVIEGVLGGTTESSALDKLAVKFADEPISFFAQLRQELQYADMPNKLKHAGHDMKSFLLRNNNSDRRSAQLSIRGQDLLLLATRVQAAQRSALTDFLQEGE